MKEADTSSPPDGDLNQKRIMYYSANWQLLEERIDDDALAQEPEVNRHMQYIWGKRYIDDIVLRRQNSDFGNDDPDITYEDTWYHLTDALFSTVAIVNSAGVEVEPAALSPPRLRVLREREPQEPALLEVEGERPARLGDGGAVPHGHGEDEEHVPLTEVSRDRCGLPRQLGAVLQADEMSVHEVGA